MYVYFKVNVVIIVSEPLFFQRMKKNNVEKRKSFVKIGMNK